MYALVAQSVERKTLILWSWVRAQPRAIFFFFFFFFLFNLYEVFFPLSKNCITCYSIYIHKIFLFFHFFTISPPGLVAEHIVVADVTLVRFQGRAFTKQKTFFIFSTSLFLFLSNFFNTFFL